MGTAMEKNTTASIVIERCRAVSRERQKVLYGLIIVAEFVSLPTTR